MGASQSYEQNPARSLRVRYAMSFGVIAALSVAAFLMVELLLTQSGAWHTTINVAGRQRMLSQRIAKAAYQGDRDTLARALSDFQQAHLALGPDGHLGRPLNSLDVLRRYADAAPSFDATVDGAQRVLASNTDMDPASFADLGLASEEFLGHMQGIVDQYDREAAADQAMVERIEAGILVMTIVSMLGSVVLVFEPAARKLHDQWGRLQRRENRFSLAIDGSRDAIWDWDLETGTIYYSPRWSEMLADTEFLSSDSLDSWMARIASPDIPRFSEEMEKLRSGNATTIDIEFQMFRRDQTPVRVLCRAMGKQDESGRTIRLAGSIADVTELHEARERLRELAELDQLTGLRNGSALRDRIDVITARASREGAFDYALLYLDFDGFKAINDALGHTQGDALLRSIANRLDEAVHEPKMLSRLGGDEFAVLLVNIDSERVLEVCDQLLEALRLPHRIAERNVICSASIGVVLGSEEYRDAESLIRDADTAMYAAKDRGRDQVRLFDRELHGNAVRRLNLQERLQTADLDRVLDLKFQPIVRLEDGRPTGVEALLRWNDSDEPISPTEFIPVAEECGAIMEIGRWVLEHAAQTLFAWDGRLGHTRTRMNVNLSRRQLMQPELLDDLAALCDRYPMLQGRLTLEITENAVMDKRADLLPTLRAIRKMGFPLAIDDFGTGHSSLSCLHEFPIDTLKIDREFVVHVEQRREFAAVMQSIVALAQNLKLNVVAEGIETGGQLAQLQAMDCQAGQGYHFAKPLSSEEALEFLGGQSRSLAA